MTSNWLSSYNTGITTSSTLNTRTDIPSSLSVFVLLLPLWPSSWTSKFTSSVTWSCKSAAGCTWETLRGREMEVKVMTNHKRRTSLQRRCLCGSQEGWPAPKEEATPRLCEKVQGWTDTVHVLWLQEGQKSLIFLTVSPTFGQAHALHSCVSINIFSHAQFVSWQQCLLCVDFITEQLLPRTPNSATLMRYGRSQKKQDSKFCVSSSYQVGMRTEGWPVCTRELPWPRASKLREKQMRTPHAWGPLVDGAVRCAVSPNRTSQTLAVGDRPVYFLFLMWSYFSSEPERMTWRMLATSHVTIFCDSACQIGPSTRLCPASPAHCLHPPLPDYSPPTFTVYPTPLPGATWLVCLCLCWKIRVMILGHTGGCAWQNSGKATKANFVCRTEVHNSHHFPQKGHVLARRTLQTWLPEPTEGVQKCREFSRDWQVWQLLTKSFSLKTIIFSSSNIRKRLHPDPPDPVCGDQHSENIEWTGVFCW